MLTDQFDENSKDADINYFTLFIQSKSSFDYEKIKQDVIKVHNLTSMLLKYYVGLHTIRFLVFKKCVNLLGLAHR